MFGANQVVGQSFFKEAPGDALLVTSIFYTIQGEGPLAGTPSVFVRLAMCNLACNFCDTWFDSGDWMNIYQIEKQAQKCISEFFEDNVPVWAELGEGCGVNLIITGGEPTMQPNLRKFIKEIGPSFKRVQIESNGTFGLNSLGPCIRVISPKCLEKNGKPVRYLVPKNEMLQSADCLKFVMTADPDSPYHTVPDWAISWAKDTGLDVFCSPMNMYLSEPLKAKKLRASNINITLEERSTIDEVISFWEPGLLDMKANQANHEYTARYCMKHGFKFQVQTHLLASLA